MGRKVWTTRSKKICYGALTIVVNHDNPVNGLTIGQLKYIYIGKIKNWQEVGGKNARIRVLGRGGRSGTEDYFEEKVLDGEEVNNRK